MPVVVSFVVWSIDQVLFLNLRMNSVPTASAATAPMSRRVRL